jgi:hypothetical protein
VASEIVEIDGLGRVKLVTSKTDDVTRHYISTDLGRSAAEILELVEHRWNLETVHQESNEKFGFKQYELRGKQGIERYIQLVFLAWTLITLKEQADVGFWEDGGGLSVRLDHAKEDFLTEIILDIFEEIDPSLPRAERRTVVHELVRFSRGCLLRISLLRRGGAELVSRPDSVDFGLSRSYKLEIVSRYSRHMMDEN